MLANLPRVGKGGITPLTWQAGNVVRPLGICNMQVGPAFRLLAVRSVSLQKRNHDLPHNAYRRQRIKNP